MRKVKFLSVLLVLLLLSASIATARSQGVGPAQQGSAAFALRTKIVNAALSRNDLFDCATYHPDSDSVLPVEQQIFRIVRDVKITPDDGREYTGAVWSPNGNAMVFVMPTGDHRDILDSDTLPSDDEARLTALGRNKLALYFLDDNTWRDLASEGGHPTWSMDGRSVYYMAGTELMKAEISTRSIVPTDLSVPNTAVGLSLNRPLSDGRLLAPRQPHAPLEVQGSEAQDFGAIEVAEGDEIIFSPQENAVIVAYGANVWQGEFTPAVAVIHHRDGKVTPLLKNCQFSAIEMVWSPDGNQIAYPVHADRSEIRIYDVESAQTQTLVRLDTHDLLSGLSWSPDGKYLAFTQGDNRSSPCSVWLVSTDGTTRQRLTEGGLLSNWSPDRKHILYARLGSNQLLDWYLVEISQQKEGV